jgi:hypothetical protein
MQRTIDVCNGDADGLFALVQLRLAEPADAILITGLKHEIDLVQRVDAQPGDRITVLDLSFERNRAAVERALDAGAWVRYFDHHAAGRLPHHPRLQAHIDPDADQCTSLIVDRYCESRFSRWAVAAAYGDNLHLSAGTLAAHLGLGPEQRTTLKLLGETVNYNAYGQSEACLLYTSPSPRDRG